MQALAPATILAVWETGRRQHPLDRALTLLLAGSLATTRDELAELSIGERDARLLRMRELTFGSRATAFTECPHCGEEMELPLETTDLFVQQNSDLPNELQVGDRMVRFRLPNSRDLAAVITENGDAVAHLVARCVEDTDLPNEQLVVALSEAILAHHPQAEIMLSLTCPACEHRWPALFDAAEFFWKEIAAFARRLLREIDCLARAYGWSEAEILSLSPQRRQTYLELIAA